MPAITAVAARNPALDGLRGLAILWVVAFHARALFGASLGSALGSARPGSAAALAESGLLGVQLFFVLSGFLLALPWLRHAAGQAARPQLGGYFRRRARRLLPPLYLHLALLFGLVLPLLPGGLALLASQLGLLNLVTHGLLLHFLHPGSASSLGLNMALWSLSIEAQFYLLLPWLVPWFAGWRAVPALAGALALALAWRHWAPGLLVPWLQEQIPAPLLVYFDPLSGQAFPYPPPLLGLFVERQWPGECFAFACGMAAASLAVHLEGRRGQHRGQQWQGQSTGRAGGSWRRWWALTAPGRPRLDLLALALLLGWALLLCHLPLGVLVADPTWRLLGQPALLLSLGLVVLAAHLQAGRSPGLASGTTTGLGLVLGNGALAALGLISYSLFLWHEPVLRLARATAERGPGLASAAGTLLSGLLLALVVAVLSYWLTERRWRCRRAGLSPVESAR